MAHDETSGEFVRVLVDAYMGERALSEALCEDVATYKCVLSQTLAHAHDLTCENRRLRRQVRTLSETRRRLRGPVSRAEAAA